MFEKIEQLKRLKIGTDKITDTAVSNISNELLKIILLYKNLIFFRKKNFQEFLIWRSINNSMNFS